MKLNNVFYGFTKDGERRLLWKRFKTEYTTMGDVGRTIYFDLEKNEYIETSHVDESTLVPVVKLVGDVHRMRKRKVIKAYKADCNLLYDVTGAFYGNIIFRTTAEKLLDNLFEDRANYKADDKVESTIAENVLFARIADPECRVEKVENGVLYPWTDRIETGYCVKEVRQAKKDLFSKAVVTKKKLLEADYRKEL